MIENKIKPTAHQQEVIEQMLTWIQLESDNAFEGSEDNFGVLTGHAGTGKSTVVSFFLQELSKRSILKYAFSTSVAAPTHKARRVIAEKTGKESTTLQSLLGLKPNTEIDNFDINNPLFSPITEPLLAEHNLHIIDESSMIQSRVEKKSDTSLYDYLKELAIKYNKKVLFVGDPLQLPPVKETDISRVFTDTKHKFELKEVIRQEDSNPLMHLYDLLRSDITNGTNHFHKFLRENPANINSKGEGYMCLTATDKAANGQILRDNFITGLDEDELFARMTTYTNQSVSSSNKQIRETILGRGNNIEVGDLLLSYGTIFNAANNAIFTNSEDLIVTNIVEGESLYGVPGYHVELVSVDTGKTGKVFFVDHNNPEKFIELINNRLETAIEYKGRAWKEYYKVKNLHLLLVNLKNTYKEPYFNKPQFFKKDIDYGYCLTVHKTQGSTYNNIILNGKNINSCSPDFRNNLWYVALSRCRKTAYIFV